MSEAQLSAPPGVHEVEAIAALTDPVLRNFRITLGYHTLATALAARLGAGTECNWCAFATWASKQAGRTIRGEDLRRAVERMLGISPGLAAALEALVAVARPLGSPCTGPEIRAAIGTTLVTDALIRRAADAVARGNRRVFEEVGRAVARFLEELDAAAARPEDAGAWLRDGDPPDGQVYLRRALRHFAELRADADPKRRAELLLLANLEIGYHEQLRVQPEIAEAANVAAPEAAEVRQRLRELLFPGGSRWLRLRAALWRRLGRPAPLDAALNAVVEQLRRDLRRIVTAHLMEMQLADRATLRLGRDLTGAYPATLARLEHPELRALLARIDATPDSLQETGARDWADPAERLHYIADLFRRFQCTPELLTPPYGAAQVAAIRAGRLPPPPH